MRVLIISQEVWRDGTNGGNVLSNIFASFDAEFAQIYCSSGQPSNNICSRYYQITDGMVVSNFFSHAPIGRKFEISAVDSKSNNDGASFDSLKFTRFFRRNRLNCFYTIQNILWSLSNIENEELFNFIDEFNPDIIFAPCYGKPFMLRLTRLIASHCDKKVISYISDDHYTLRQFSLSPFFWINRFALRAALRKTFPFYSLTYTMTDEQKEQCEHDFKANMKILRKGASYENLPRQECGSPVRCIYAGGIYLNRWKVLSQVADAIDVCNLSGLKMRLDIYTSSEITRSISNALLARGSCFIHRPVPQDELKKIYRNSDVALHVESFDLKNRLLVRMSFSTKIVDCISSGCAVLAICDKKQAGLMYLKKQNAALCASSKEEISRVVSLIANNPDIVCEYARRANECCVKMHNPKEVHDMIKKDFEFYATC